MKTILMAVRRHGGKDEVIHGTEIPLAEQVATLHNLFKSGSDKYSAAGVYFLEAHQEVPLPSKVQEKSNMKNILASILVLFALAFSFTAAAQSAAIPLTLPTQTIAVGAVTNVNQVIDVTAQASVSFVLTAKQSAAGTNGPIKLLFDYSNDAYATTPKWSTATKAVTFAATGLTELVGQTNIPTYGARYIRWKSLENADSAIITNSTATYAVKVGAP